MRATSTSLNLLHRLDLQYLDDGALFALTASPSSTPTLSANNLGSPKPNGTTAKHLLVLFKATGLVLCRVLPTQSASEMVLLAWGAPLLMVVSVVSRIALVSMLCTEPHHPPGRHLVAPPTKS